MHYIPRFIALMLVVIAAGAGESVLAADKAATTAGNDVMARLSPNTRKLLTEEMVAINAASQKIVAALVSGDKATVAMQAQAIHDSFILDKKLKKADREELEKVLPHDFVILDTVLHGRAQRLANAAKSGDLELASYFFNRMIEACQSCHSRFAVGKFPGFAMPTQEHKQH